MRRNWRWSDPCGLNIPERFIIYSAEEMNAKPSFEAISTANDSFLTCNRRRSDMGLSFMSIAF